LKPFGLDSVIQKRVSVCPPVVSSGTALMHASQACRAVDRLRRRHNRRSQGKGFVTGWLSTFRIRSAPGQPRESRRMDNRLSEAEWLELEWRMEVSAHDGDTQVRQLLVAFMNEHGRIPTPADDGTSGWSAREICQGDDEQLVQTRFAGDDGAVAVEADAASRGGAGDRRDRRPVMKEGWRPDRPWRTSRPGPSRRAMKVSDVTAPATVTRTRRHHRSPARDISTCSTISRTGPAPRTRALDRHSRYGSGVLTCVGQAAAIGNAGENIGSGTPSLTSSRNELP
jgi:hypothetical protein